MMRCEVVSELIKTAGRLEYLKNQLSGERDEITLSSRKLIVKSIDELDSAVIKLRQHKGE